MTAQSPFTMEKQPEAGASRYGHAWHFAGAKVKHHKSFSFPSKDQLYQCHQCRQQAPASGATSKQSPWLAKASRTKAALGWQQMQGCAPEQDCLHRARITGAGFAAVNFSSLLQLQHTSCLQMLKARVHLHTGHLHYVRARLSCLFRKFPHMQ